MNKNLALMGLTLLPSVLMAQDAVLTPDYSGTSALPEHIFAVPVSHAFDARKDGAWVPVGEGRMEWRYAVQLMGATSASVHLTRVDLPASAVLRVLPGDEAVSAVDLPLADHYSWPVAGDTVDLRLSVLASEAGAVVLEGNRFFAGFRDDTPIVPAKNDVVPAPSPTAQPPRAQASHQIVNYDCVAASNPGLRTLQRATASVFVDGLGSCTGTLVNHADSDNKAWVITAAHCGDTLPGEAESGASSVTVRWDKVTPCGQALQNPARGVGVRGSATVYSDTGTTGDKSDADDLWVIELVGYPAANTQAYVYGFDASEAIETPVPLFMIHHGGNQDQQFARLDWWSAGNVGFAGEYPRFHPGFYSVVQEGGTRGGTSGGGVVSAEGLLVSIHGGGAVLSEPINDGSGGFHNYAGTGSYSLHEAFTKSGSPLVDLFGAMQMAGREMPVPPTPVPTPTPTATPVVTPTAAPTPPPTGPVVTLPPTAPPQSADGGGGGGSLGLAMLPLLLLLRRQWGRLSIPNKD